MCLQFNGKQGGSSIISTCVPVVDRQTAQECMKRCKESGNMHHNTHSSGQQLSGFISLLLVETAFAASELLKCW